MNRQFITIFKETKDWFDNNQSDKFAVDTETTSLRYDDLRLVGISFCNGENACYIDLFENKEYADIIGFINLQFWDNIKKIVFHSAPFDLMVFWKCGLKNLTKNIFCTKTAAHLLDENRPTGLKYLARYVLKKKKVIDYKDVEGLPKNHPKFYEYAINDSINTWELYEVFAPQLQHQKLDELFYSIEMPFQFSLRDLAVNGILADKDKVEPLKKELKDLIFNLELEMVKSAKLPYGIQKNLFDDTSEVISFNFNSPKQLVEIITKYLGLKITELTDGGDLSVSKSSLQKLAGQHKFIDLLRKYNKVTDFMQKSVNPFEDWVQLDGRIRTDYKNTGTVTGRLSSRNPNLQNLPRPGEF